MESQPWRYIPDFFGIWPEFRYTYQKYKGFGILTKNWNRHVYMIPSLMWLTKPIAKRGAMAYQGYWAGFFHIVKTLWMTKTKNARSSHCFYFEPYQLVKPSCIRHSRSNHIRSIDFDNGHWSSRVQMLRRWLRLKQPCLPQFLFIYEQYVTYDQLVLLRTYM